MVALNIAIAGAGSAGTRLGELLRTECGVEPWQLVFVRRGKVHNPYGDKRLTEALKGVRSTSDICQAFRWAQAVIVANPTHLHTQTAQCAVRAGCHVLIEKPLGSVYDKDEPSRVSALQEGAHKRGLVVIVGYNLRFHEQAGLMRQWLPLVGSVRHAESETVEDVRTWHPWEDYKTSYAVCRALGGGVMWHPGVGPQGRRARVQRGLSSSLTKAHGVVRRHTEHIVRCRAQAFLGLHTRGCKAPKRTTGGGRSIWHPQEHVPFRATKWSTDTHRINSHFCLPPAVTRPGIFLHATVFLAHFEMVKSRRSYMLPFPRICQGLCIEPIEERCDIFMVVGEFGIAQHIGYTFFKIYNKIFSCRTLSVKGVPRKIHAEFFCRHFKPLRREIVNVGERDGRIKKMFECHQYQPARVNPVGAGQDDGAARLEHTLEPLKREERVVHVLERAE